MFSVSKTPSELGNLMLKTFQLTLTWQDLAHTHAFLICNFERGHFVPLRERSRGFLLLKTPSLPLPLFQPSHVGEHSNDIPIWIRKVMTWILLSAIIISLGQLIWFCLVSRRFAWLHWPELDVILHSAVITQLLIDVKLRCLTSRILPWSWAWH